MSDHGLTPVRPRTTPLEATILEELRELRERVAKLEAHRPKRSSVIPCDQCYHVHDQGERCDAETNWRQICGCEK